LNYRLLITLLCFASLSYSAGQSDVALVRGANVGQAIITPAPIGSRLPRLRLMPNGDVLMSWIEPRGDGHVLKFGQLHNGHWIKSGEVSHGLNWFVNWADYPSVVAIDANFWAAHWLVRQKGGKAFDYDVRMAISNDAGLSWREIGSPHRDRTASEHGFVTIFKDADGAGVIWLDGRDYVKKDVLVHHPEKSANFNLRYTHISRDGDLGDEVIVDANTCTCCWTSVALTDEGPVAAWRSRTGNEIRDNKVALMRSGKWTLPVPLGDEGWVIEGCPVNGPSLASRGHQVAAAWFTAQGDRPRVRASFSSNHGETFGPSIDVDVAAPLGRIGLDWKDEHTAVISWMTAANQDKKSSLAFRLIKKDGRLGPIRHTAELSPGREAGVPQMIAAERGLLLAWTDVAPHYGIKMHAINWHQLQADKFQFAGLQLYMPQSDQSGSLVLSAQHLVSKNLLPFSPYICKQPHSN